MKVSINLTQDDQAGTVYTVQSLIGTCQLAIGEKVSKERVTGWCAMAQVIVRVSGMTEEPESPEQLDLCLGDPIKKQIQDNKPRKSPRKPAGSPLKALPAPSISVAK